MNGNSRHMNPALTWHESGNASRNVVLNLAFVFEKFFAEVGCPLTDEQRAELDKVREIAEAMPS